MLKRLMLVAAMVLVAVSCGGGSEGSGDPGTTQPDQATTTTESDDAPETTAGPATTTTEASGSGGSSAGWIVVDGERLEFTDVYECQIGQDGGSPDYREFGGRTADGSADLSVAYFPPDDAFASLTGVDVEREVDGATWTYSSTYAGSDGQFSADLNATGASGTAEVGVVGEGNPYGGDTVISEWGFNCG